MMQKKDNHTVILGNGVAGNSAASAIRKENENGSITMISQEPFPEYRACVLSKKYIAGDIEWEKVFLKKLEDYSKEGIKILFGKRVTRIDTEKGRVIINDNHTVSYDKLIIATGGKPIVPPLPGVDKEGIFTLKSLQDAENILRFSGRKVVVIGAGPIGIEASISLRKRGWQVSLVELMSRVLPTMFDEKPSSVLEKRMEEYGIQVLTGEKATGFQGDKRVQSVITDKREIECDMVILVLGIRPEVGLANEAGIEIGSLGGIKVNEQMMTNVKNIYACGDCVETRDVITGKNILCLLWFNGKKQGEVAGYNAAENGRNFHGGMIVGGVDVLGTNAVSIGHTKSSLRGARLKVIEGETNKVYHRLLVSDGVLVGAQLIGEIPEIGPLVSAIRRHDSLKKIRSILEDGSLLSLNPLYIKLYPFISEGSLLT